MRKEYKKSEKQRLKEELLKLKKENKKLSEKLDKSKSINKELKKEIKKNDTQEIIVNQEQKHLLSSKLNDMDIQSLLFD